MNVESPDSVIFKFLLRGYSLLNYDPSTMNLKINTKLEHNALR